MRRFALLASLAFLSCLLPAPARAQGSAEIAGYVRVSNSSEPPPGTLVTLHSDAGEIIQQVTPEAGGRFAFSFLTRGVYYVSARALGYREVSERADVTLIHRLTVFLTLIPDRPPPQPQPSAASALIQQRQLRIPAEARKEYERGQKELANGKPDIAVEHLEKAKEIYPEYVEAEELIGTIYMDQQKWDKAEKSLNKCVEMDPQFPGGYIALGALYNRTGRFDEAERVLERGVELDPNAWQGHFELGTSLLVQNKVKEAEAHARRAHELQPKYPLVHLLAGNVALHQNDLMTARNEFGHFLALLPDSPLAPAVKAKIAEIDTALRSTPAPTPQP